MEFILVIIVVIVILFIIAFLNEPKEKLGKDYSIKDEVKKPLSRETLRNINENRNNSYSRVKNTFFDLPYHNENYESDFDNKDELLIVRVVGVTNKNFDNRNRQDILKECLEGEQLVLVKEIDNKFSRYAIKVCRLNGEQIGYLEDKLSQKIHFRDMSTAAVYIDEIIGGTEDKPNLGCLIEIKFS